MTKKRKIDIPQEDSSSSSEVDKTKTSFSEVVKMVNEGNIELLREIIKDNPKVVHEKDKEKNSLLHYAVARGNKEMVELLLEGGSDIESKDYFGNTSLHIAACNIDLKLIRFLIEEWNANVKVVNGANKTVLHSAASGMIDEESKEDWEVIEYLLEKGVPTSVITKGGFSVSDIFFSKDWSYADIYEKKKKEWEDGKVKTKCNEKKNLEEEIEKILDSLLPEENADNYTSIKSLLETIVFNQKQLIENADDLSRINLNATKEFAVSKNLDREKIEELCQKVVELVEITNKKNRIEFIEEQGKVRLSR